MGTKTKMTGFELIFLTFFMGIFPWILLYTAASTYTGRSCPPGTHAQVSARFGATGACIADARR